MDTESKDIIQEQVKKLPQEVRDALASDELSTKIHAVGNTHRLHIDQIGTLEDEVTLAMMGLSEIDELPNQLVEQLSISKADADALVKDINDTIFVPIQESMKKTDSGKSVVMPSSIAAAKPVAPAPISTPTPTAPLSNQVTAPVANLEINAPAASTNTPSAPVNNAPTPVVKPVAAPIHEADVILNEPTVSMPPKVEVAPTSTASTSSGQAAPAVPNITTKVEPPKPAPIYKADPYREPIE